MNRRQFLRGFVGVAATAGVIETLAPARSIFLPPRGGWMTQPADAGVPSFLTNYIDPQILDILVRPTRYIIRMEGETDAQLRARMFERRSPLLTVEFYR